MKNNPHAHSAGLLRHEDLRLITGSGKFSADWTLEGQLHSAIIRSDVASGKLKSVDLDQVRAAPGVKLVLTAEDVREAGFGDIPSGPPLKNPDGEEASKQTMPLLANETVKFVGQPIAMVIADTALQAQDAAALVFIDYEELPVAVDALRALEKDTPPIHEAKDSNLFLHFNHGDREATDTAFAAAAFTSELTVKSQRLIGAPMEPRACNASHDPTSGITTVYSPTQGLNGMRAYLQAIIGSDGEDIDVIAEDVGGSFGVRAGAFSETALVILAARKLGRPVKWIGRRSELFIGEWHGRGLTLHGQIALDSDHNITAIRFDDTVDIGAFNCYFGGFIGTNNLWVTMGGAYRVPALYMESKLVWTNTLPVSAYRGAGRPDIAFAIERLIEHTAKEHNLDPVEFRQQNFVPRDAFPYTTANGSEYDCGDFHGVLDKALKLSDYDSFAARANAAEAEGKLRGIGIGYYVEKSGAGGAPKDQVSCRFQNDGTLQLFGVTGPSGQGHETTFAAIVSDALGIDAGLIGFTAGKSSEKLIGNGTGGSRSLYGAGSAFKNLALEIINKAKPHAARILKCEETDLQYANGKFTSSKGAGETLGLTDLAVDLADSDAAAHPLNCDAHTITGANYPNGCHIAEIEISPQSGVVEVVTYTAVDDLGNVISPTLVEGQVHGGVVQGVGQAFMEQAVYDENGQLLSGSFMDYALPRAGSISEFRIGSYPVPTQLNELGAKGVGESGCSGSLPAISNAMMQALGKVGAGPIDMPYTPPKVWKAIKDVENRKESA